jgi:ESCRT-II complex subunit VPS22
MRRGMGMAGLQQQRQLQATAEKTGARLDAERMEHVQSQLAVFRSQLERFASKHRADINRDPEFRRQFVKMCRSIGIDPLASNKGFWAETLGMGDFYYELAVQVVDVCLATRGTNGGLIAMPTLLQRLRAIRKGTEISEDDVKRAIRKLSHLGGGYQIVAAGGERYVVSVPAALTTDNTQALQAAAARGSGGAITQSQLAAACGWEPDRARRALHALAKEGMAWVDGQGAPGDGLAYYFPSIFFAPPPPPAAAAAAGARGGGGGGGPSGGAAGGAGRAGVGSAAGGAASGGAGSDSDG